MSLFHPLTISLFWIRYFAIPATLGPTAIPAVAVATILVAAVTETPVAALMSFPAVAVDERLAVEEILAVTL